MAVNTFGVIVGNRGFFPDVLAEDGHRQIVEVLHKNGYEAVILSPQESKFGAVETFAEAKQCAELFRKHADQIDGIIVTLPNFGDEKGVMEAVRRARLEVPVLIHAEPDAADHMGITRRRDSFCGKISACNNLRQARISYSLTSRHTAPLASAGFKEDLDNFAAICRVVKGLRDTRFGAIGARPGAFNTVRYSEKLLEQTGITVETLDLSEILGKANRLGDKDEVVANKLAAIKDYTTTKGIPAESLTKLAKFGVVVDEWAHQQELDGIAIQCWTSLQENFGVCSCTQMSMMSDALLPNACEVDITGVLAMYILQLAGQSPSALLDWNNNYADDPDKCVCFHCSNLPKSFFKEMKMDYQEIIAGSVGKKNTFGTVVGRIKASPATLLRISTTDAVGEITGYVSEGEFTEDVLETFGGYGVLKVENLQALMRYICEMGFEHHVAANMTERADAIYEALVKYLDWDIYRHE